MALFGKSKSSIIKIVKKKQMPDGLWTKCDSCGEIIYNKVLEEQHKICPKCEHHFVLNSTERLALLLDGDSFEEWDAELRPVDPLRFEGPKSYRQKLKDEQQALHMFDACRTGVGRVDGQRIAIGATDSRFFMGSMGSVVGERITRMTERATDERLPLVIVSGSGGGARMHEGMYSLMQLAKTSAALQRFQAARGLYISILTNPTMAGVLASFASLGDVVMAEPKALIGFTGPRVIEQTLRQRLPQGFQRSEFLLEHGLIDMVVHRKQLKSTIAQLTRFLG